MKMCTHTLSLLHMLEGTRYFVDYEKEYAILTQMILFQLNNLPNYDLLIQSKSTIIVIIIIIAIIFLFLLILLQSLIPNKLNIYNVVLR